MFNPTIDELLIQAEEVLEQPLTRSQVVALILDNFAVSPQQASQYADGFSLI